MMLRYLRIAFSAMCVVVCVLLIALWLAVRRMARDIFQFASLSTPVANNAPNTVITVPRMK